MVKSNDIKSHQEYLAKVPRDITKRRLEKFRLSEEVFDNTLPPICGRDFFVVPSESKPFVHPLEPLTLFDLKNWFGVPNEVARNQINSVQKISGNYQVRNRLARVQYRNLPRKERFEFAKLEPEQQVTVRQAARNLLYSYIDEEELKRKEIAGVVNFMLEATIATTPQIFVAPDLIVCPDDKIEFVNIPVVMFNNILIYGNGEVSTKSPLSIDAYQIRHIS